MIIIGRIKENNGSNFPALRSLINSPIVEKERVLHYMEDAPVISAAVASMKDVLTGEFTGRELLVHSDGKYLWRSDVTYYVDKYDMKLPDDFIGHVLAVDSL